MFPARILVLADRAVTTAVARALLARAGFDNVVTRPLSDLLSWGMELERSDLVLVDVTGPAVARSAVESLLRSRGDGAGPPVLALARDPRELAAARIAANGALEVLPWPDDKADLGHCVGEMLGLKDLPRVTREADDSSEPVPARLVEAGGHPDDSYRRLFRDAPAPLLVVSGQASRVVAANAAATQLTGYGLEELVTLDVHDLFLDGERVAGFANAAPRREQGRRRDTCRLLTRAGQVEDVEVNVRRHTHMGEPAIVLHLDVVADREVRTAPAERALRDHEAGLGAQALFHSRLARAVSARGAHERIALLLVAFDRSATEAERAGEGEPLFDAALLLRCSVRASDTTAYLGGGRFAVLLEDLRSPESAPAVAERLLEEITRPPQDVDHAEVVGSARLGLAFGDRLRSPDELLWRAEHAVSRAREQDRPALVLFQSPLERAVRRHTTLARDLRAAVAAGRQSLEDGTLRVVYQPQVEIATRRVVGVEALVRWVHPIHGEVSPESFIAIAEDVGIIADLDALVLRQTLEDARTWGFDTLPIAVNVSGAELEDPAYAEGVIDLIQSTGAGAFQLEIEITERLAIEPTSPAVANVARLRAAGIGVSIDDFGTGPAAFTTLRSVAASRIKIDRSFIADIAAGEVRALAAIVAMARGLGLETIAEGVETPEQCARLVEYGCLLAQGFFFAPPIGAAELVRFLAQTGTSLVGVPMASVAAGGRSRA